MKFKVNGQELDAGQMRIREICEAEKALGMDLGETGLGGKMAVSLFVAIRRVNPDKHPVEIADEVLAVSFEDLETIEEDDESPPAEGGDGVREPVPVNPPTSGPPLSAVSA
jgi:hypothetical protein